MRIDFLPEPLIAYLGKLKHKPDPLSVVKLYIEKRLDIPQTMRELRNIEDRWIKGLAKRAPTPRVETVEQAQKLRTRSKGFRTHTFKTQNWATTRKALLE